MTEAAEDVQRAAVQRNVTTSSGEMISHIGPLIVKVSLTLIFQGVQLCRRLRLMSQRRETAN